jgi:hypothetical protein
MQRREIYYEEELKRYTVLYFLLGVVEHELRARIPIAMSDYAYSRGIRDWWEVVPQSYQNLKSIERATKKNGNSLNGFEQHLPFSFWRYIFVGENFPTFWRESLHTIFPNLKNALTKTSYDQICNRIYLAYQLRNKIAHYELQTHIKFEREKERLLWMINMLAGPSA